MVAIRDAKGEGVEGAGYVLDDLNLVVGNLHDDAYKLTSNLR